MFLVVSVGILLCLCAAFIFRTEIEKLYLEKSALFVDYYYLIIPIGIFYVIFMTLEIYLRGFYKNIISVISFEIILRLLLSLLLILLWLKLISFQMFVVLQSFSYAIPVIILLIYLKRINELFFSFSAIQISKRFRKIIVRFSTFNYINTLGSVVVNSLDIIMISQMLGLKAAGVYSTVIFLTSALQVPYKSLIRISSPLIADFWKHRKLDQIKTLYTNVSSIALLIGLGPFILFWLNIDFLFSFLSNEFQEGIWVFLFIMLGRIIDMYFGLNGAIFVTSKKYAYDIIFTLFLLVAVFILNSYFIPIWGISGAAISTSIALIVYNVSRVFFVLYSYKIHPFNRNQFIIIALAILTLSFGLLLNQNIHLELFRIPMTIIEIGILFVLPVVLFKLEPETTNYFMKASKFLKIKLTSLKTNR